MLVQRILADDPAEHMPPANSGKKLSADQIELLKRWVAQGGRYEGHWAFLPRKASESVGGTRSDLQTLSRIDALVDADLANNTQGWQWTAGCGADAAPYFRVFSPITQGERYDTGGMYVRKWVPELAGLADEWVHRPWEAPADVLDHAGVRLGETYPEPIVDHALARRRALRAYEGVRIRRAANPSRRDRP